MIKIIDNFFDEKDLISIQDFALTKAYYTPKYFDNTTEKNKINYFFKSLFLRKPLVF